MAWNRPRQSREVFLNSQSAVKKTFFVRLTLCILLGAIAVYSFLRLSSAGPVTMDESCTTQKIRLISDVGEQNTNAEPNQAEEVFPNSSPSPTTDKSAAVDILTKEEESKIAREKALAELPPALFTNSVDQLLAMVLSQDPNAEMAPLPELDETVDYEFVRALNKPIEILDTDDAVVREMKALVIQGRKEIDEALRGSKTLTVGKILNQYRDTFNGDLHLRTNAEVAIREFIIEGDFEGAAAYAEKVNVVFRDAGIPEVTVDMPKKKRRRSR